MIELSIVVVSWNTCSLLRDCLASISEGVDGLRTEVFVVDNDSADDSAAMVRNEFPQYTLIESGGNIGFARGNNIALKQASGRALLLLNPDTVCKPSSLKELHGYLFSEERVGIAGPILLDENDAPTISTGRFPALVYHWLGALDPQRVWLPGAARRMTFTEIPERGQPSGPVDYVAGACLMIRREVVEQIGLLDERFFMYFEETDWCRRALDAGWTSHLCTTSEVAHLEGRSAARAADFTLRQLQKSMRLYVEKHHGRRKVAAFRLAFFAEFLSKSIGRLLMRVVRRRREDSALLSNHWRTARLQLAGEVEATPPQRTRS